MDNPASDDEEAVFTDTHIYGDAKEHPVLDVNDLNADQEGSHEQGLGEETSQETEEEPTPVVVHERPGEHGCRGQHHPGHDDLEPAKQV